MVLEYEFAPLDPNGQLVATHVAKAVKALKDDVSKRRRQTCKQPPPKPPAKVKEAKPNKKKEEKPKKAKAKAKNKSKTKRVLSDDDDEKVRTIQRNFRW